MRRKEGVGRNYQERVVVVVVVVVLPPTQQHARHCYWERRGELSLSESETWTKVIRDPFNM